ncbi:hypothetical protein ACQKWADRAFT_318192 [Trichoderma austrokoningii]
MPVTLKLFDHAAEIWTAPRVTTDSELLKEAYPKQHETMKSVLASSFDPRLLDKSHISAAPNGFVYSACFAYDNHHHLTIRPDDVWFAILSQFGFFVNNNSTDLHRVLAAEGPKRLAIEYHGSGDGGPGLYADFARQMNDILFDNIRNPLWTIPSFSTTTPTDRTVASVLLMGTMQKYHEYKMSMQCGIPSVTLLGEVGDWIDILERTNYIELFAEFSSQPFKFVQLLRPILQHMIHSFTNPLTFCFWDEEGEWQSGWPWLPGLDGVLYTSIPLDRIPACSASFPMIVERDGKMHECTMLAGSVGIQASSPGEQTADIMSNLSTEALDALPSWDPDAHDLRAIQPVSGWWIFEQKTAEGEMAEGEMLA